MKVSTTISLEQDVLEEARAFAATQRRSLSNQIETWIAEKLGLDPQPEEQPATEEVEA